MNVSSGVWSIDEYIKCIVDQNEWMKDIWCIDLLKIDWKCI